MRITLLIDHLACGGAQRQLCMLALLLKRRGFDVTILTYHPTNDFFQALPEGQGIPVRSVLTRTKLGRILAMRQAIRGENPDAVVAFLHTPNLLAELSSLPSRNYAVVVSERSSDFSGFGRRSFLRFQLHRLADAIITNSHAQRDFIARHAAHLASRLHVITNCVDFDSFHPAFPSTPTRRTNLLVLGNFGWKKNPVNFGRAVRLACEQLPAGELLVHWYGNNFFRDGRPTSCSAPFVELQRYIAREGLADCLHLHEPTRDVLGKYHWASAVCVPSIIEGFPNVIGEAMACGLPVLASRTGDNSRLVSPGENGYLFDPRSPVEMAGAIVRFAKQPTSVRRAFGRASLDKARGLLSPHLLVERYEQVLTGVCRSRPGVRMAA